MCLPFTGPQIASFLWRLDAGEKTIYATEVGPDGFGKGLENVNTRSAINHRFQWLRGSHPAYSENMWRQLRPILRVPLAQKMRIISIIIVKQVIFGCCIPIHVDYNNKNAVIEIASALFRLNLRWIGSLTKATWDFLRKNWDWTWFKQQKWVCIWANI